MLVTSIFSFFQNVFYPFRNKFQVTFILLSAKAFNLDQSKILFGKELTLSQTSTSFYVSAIQSFENIVGNGEITGNEQFLLFSLFSTHLENFLPFLLSLKLSSSSIWVWKSLKVVIWEMVKLKELADSNFKVDVNGTKFSIQVENAVAKGEIGC